MCVHLQSNVQQYPQLKTRRDTNLVSKEPTQPDPFGTIQPPCGPLWAPPVALTRSEAGLERGSGEPRGLRRRNERGRHPMASGSVAVIWHLLLLRNINAVTVSEVHSSHYTSIRTKSRHRASVIMNQIDQVNKDWGGATVLQDKKLDPATPFYGLKLVDN